MVRNNVDAAAASLRTTRNVTGTCQLQTRTWFDAPSAGDRDGDRDADANDGWKSEPASARHLNRNAPLGRPGYFKNKSGKGFGHRAMSLGGGKFRSTDMSNGRYKAGYTGTATLQQIEQAMGLIFVGWSDTITGIKIPIKAPAKAPAQAAPSQAPKQWTKNRFVHADSSNFIDYAAAIEKAAKLNVGVDIDGQKSKQGTGWGLHWGTVGKNHLHDPKGLIKATRRIDSLTDAEITRLRGPKGQKVHRLSTLLAKCLKLGVRAEVEVKVRFGDDYAKRFMTNKNIKTLHQKGLLQIKTLAQMASPIHRLAPFDKYGAVTILSFTDYTGKGISKKAAWPEVDYVRGKAKWVA